MSNSDQPEREHDDTITQDKVTMRRAPKYGRFILAGFLLGVIAALILTYAFPPNEQFDRAQVFGFLLLVAGTVGVTLGAVVALVIDRSSAKRAQTLVAERDHVIEHDETDAEAPVADASAPSPTVAADGAAPDTAPDTALSAADASESEPRA